MLYYNNADIKYLLSISTHNHTIHGQKKEVLIMIERKDLFTIPFYKKTHFSGSYQGMHYRIERIEQDDQTALRATVCPGPY